MSKIFRLFRFVLKESSSDKMKSIQIIFLFLKTDIILKFFPLNRYFYKYFETNGYNTADIQSYIKDIRLIKKIGRYLPGKYSCLKESIALHLYLRRKNIYAPIILGIKKNRNIFAHSWLDPNEKNDFNRLILTND